MTYRLVCFDLDGTIIDDTEFIWYTLHRHFRVDMAQVKRWHRLFLDGKVTYEQWFAEDIKWWNAAGARKPDYIAAVKSLRLMQGAEETIRELKRRGLKIAIVSGSLNIVIDTFFPKHPFDYVFVNEIHFDRRGRVAGFRVTPYDFEHKATAVKEIALKEGIGLEECVFVGDNVNDVDAVRISGQGISFNSKSRELDRAADVVIRRKDLRGILAHVFPDS